MIIKILNHINHKLPPRTAKYYRKKFPSIIVIKTNKKRLGSRFLFSYRALYS